MRGGHPVVADPVRTAVDRVLNGGGAAVATDGVCGAGGEKRAAHGYAEGGQGRKGSVQGWFTG